MRIACRVAAVDVVCDRRAAVPVNVLFDAKIPTDAGHRVVSEQVRGMLVGLYGGAYFVKGRRSENVGCSAVAYDQLKPREYRRVAVPCRVFMVVADICTGGY